MQVLLIKTFPYVLSGFPRNVKPFPARIHDKRCGKLLHALFHARKKSRRVRRFSHFAQFVVDSTAGFILYWIGRNHLRSQDNFFWPQQVYIAG